MAGEEGISPLRPWLLVFTTVLEPHSATQALLLHPWAGALCPVRRRRTDRRPLRGGSAADGPPEGERTGGVLEAPGAAVRPAKNQFHNFEQRDTDYDAMVLERLKERLGDS